LPRNAIWIISSNVVQAAAPGTPEIVLAPNPESVNAFNVQVAPDGSRIAFTEFTNEGRARFGVLNAQTGEKLQLGDVFNSAFVSPRFSPDSRRLAYTMIDQSDPAKSSWQLQIVGPADDEVKILKREVTDPPATHTLQPLAPVAWTPDGIYVEQLLWNSDAPPQNLSLVNPESGDVQLISDKQYMRMLVSPDGKLGARVTGIFAMGPDVQGETTLTMLDLATGRETPLFEKQSFWMPVLRWSPDSERLVYARQAGVGSGLVTALNVIAADGTGEQTLAIGGTGVRGQLRDAAWLDAETLLLLVHESDNKVRLYSLPLATLNREAMQEIAEFDPPPSGNPNQEMRILYVPQ
jgi:Tol biopolymer transport system component